MYYQGNQTSHAVDTYVHPLLSKVLQTQRFGSCRRSISVHELKSKDGKNCDCIDLAVPYADQTLKWTVLFDSEFPELGPDFLFNDENFLANPDLDTLSRWVPSLKNWNYCDNNSLLIVLKELLAYYKNYQIELLKVHCTQRIILEYETLIEKVQEENVEVIILKHGTKSAEVKFFIRLIIDFSKIPQKTMHHPQSDAAMLLVTFSGVDFSNVVPSLFLTKAVEEILGSQENMQIPPFPTHNGMLIDYVPTIEKYLADKVENVIKSFKKKRDFMSTLLLCLRGSIIEYDAVEFTQASFLVEKKDFHFFIHFRIPPGFPRDRPDVVMQSAYHMDQSSKMITHTVTKFSINSQMEPLKMVLTILNHIEDKEVESFQQVCTRKHRFY